jgi:hypothetical protein
MKDMNDMANEADVSWIMADVAGRAMLRTVMR